MAEILTRESMQFKGGQGRERGMRERLPRQLQSQNSRSRGRAEEEDRRAKVERGPRGGEEPR